MRILYSDTVDGWIGNSIVSMMSALLSDVALRIRDFSGVGVTQKSR